MLDHRERFAHYLRQRLDKSGLSARALSLQLDRDPNYISQLLAQPKERPRALPSPAELKKLAPLLGVSVFELLHVAWGIEAADLATEGSASVIDRPAGPERWGLLTHEEQGDVEDYIEYLLTRRKRRRRTRTTPLQTERARLNS